MSYIAAVRVDGVPLDLGRIVADVQTVHGRGSVQDGPTASTCTLSLLDVTVADAAQMQVGASLSVDSASEAIFRGYVTDSTIRDDDPDGRSTLTVTGIGRLARLGGVLVGAAGFPAETWANRVNRVLLDAGLAGGGVDFVIGIPDFDYALAAREPGDPTDALSLLGELADTGGAAIFDRPDGKILVQALDSRSSTPRPVDPALVAYSPEWIQRIDVSNEITGEYVGGTFTLRDDASVARYGLAPATVQGLFAAELDCRLRVQAALIRRSFTRWSTPQLELLAPIAGLAVGDLLTIPMLPASAPGGTTATAIVEAIGLTTLGAATSVTLVLSDPVDSGAVVRWVDVPADVAWNEVPPTTRWVDAYDIDNIVPTATEVPA